MEKTEFFQNVLSHLEDRVWIVDSRSDIFLAVALGLLVAYGYLTKEFFYNSGGYFFLGIHIILSLSSCLLFLQALRPSRYFFFGSAAPKQPECEKYLFWPEHNDCTEGILENDAEFEKCIQSFDSVDILRNYHKVLQVELNIIKSKYRFYRIAVSLFKFLIVFDIIALTGLLITQKIL